MSKWYYGCLPGYSRGWWERIWMGHDRSDATLAARCPMQHSYETAAFWRDKIFYLYSKSKMYYLFERSWGNVHKDFKCHALCLSVLGNKYIVYMSHNKRKSQHINMSTQYVRCRSSHSDVKYSSSKLSTCIASWLYLTLSGPQFKSQQFPRVPILVRSRTSCVMLAIDPDVEVYWHVDHIWDEIY